MKSHPRQVPLKSSHKKVSKKLSENCTDKFSDLFFGKDAKSFAASIIKIRK
jgi:hypothetical protein